MKIILGGDTHGDRNQVRWLLEKAQKADAAGVFVLGDFGVWDHGDAGAFTNGVAVDAKRAGMKVWFLPGNHENYDILDELEKTRPRNEDGFVQYGEGLDTLLYSPRGHRWTWEGVDFLSLGGAYSVDKGWRIVEDEKNLGLIAEKLERDHKLTSKQKYLLKTGHGLWWPQEEITEEEAGAAADGPEVDVMLAHDKPMDAELAWNRKDFPETHPNQQKLQKVVDAAKPTSYLHGHFHYAYQDHLMRSDTQVFGLDCEPEGSRGSGGSGDRKVSWAQLHLRPTWYTVTWQERDGQILNRDFVTKGRRGD